MRLGRWSPWFLFPTSSRGVLDNKKLAHTFFLSFEGLVGLLFTCSRSGLSAKALGCSELRPLFLSTTRTRRVLVVWSPLHEHCCLTVFHRSVGRSGSLRTCINNSLYEFRKHGVHSLGAAVQSPEGRRASVWKASPNALGALSKLKPFQHFFPVYRACTTVLTPALHGRCDV